MDGPDKQMQLKKKNKKNRYRINDRNILDSIYLTIFAKKYEIFCILAVAIVFVHISVCYSHFIIYEPKV